MIAKLLPILLLLGCVNHAMAIELVDDNGHLTRLDKPAERIISLAPHLTELMFSIGAGDKLLAVSEYSDFPDQAAKLPRAGGAGTIDVERIVSLQPDLVLAWKTGTPAIHQEKLRQLKIPIVVFGFNRLEDVARGMVALGRLTGTERGAEKAGREYLDTLGSLKKTYANRKTVSVFYQLWSQPLMTVNADHMLNDMIEACGGKNIFSGQTMLVPTVDIEAVIRRAPQAIVISSGAGKPPDWRKPWRQWTSIPAVKNNHLFYIESDLVVRQSARVLLGLDRLCRNIDRVRNEH